MKERCPFCPKEYQSRKDMHRHLKKIHDCDLEDNRLDDLIRELRIGDLCDWKEENVS